MKCPIDGFFLLIIIISWGDSGKAILQVSIAVFPGALGIFFSGKDDSAL